MRQQHFAVALLVFMSLCVMPCIQPSQAKTFPTRVTQAFDQESQLECHMEILKDLDGGVYAVRIALRNTSDDRDLVLEINADLSYAILMTLMDDKGEKLSKPPKRIRIDEDVVRFSTVHMPKSTSRHWFIPIADRLQNRAFT